MQIKEENDRQGWRVLGSDKEKMRVEIEKRYSNSGISCVDELVKKVVFYPVYKLGSRGI